MSVLNSFETGTTFIDSITAGVFSGYGNATSGVPMGVTLCYTWNPAASGNVLASPDTNPNFATAKGAYVNLNPAKLATPFTVENYQVNLDCCRLIKITASEPFTVFASVRDFYGKRMTFGGSSSEVESVNQFVSPRGVSAICSIRVSGGAGLSDVQIVTMDALELPFADYNQAPVAFVNYDQKPLLGIYDQDATPYSAKSLYNLTNSVLGKDQTLSTGCVRPIFTLGHDEEALVPPPFGDDRVLTIGQVVDGYGFNIPIPQTDGLDESLTKQEKNPFLNVGYYVYGDASYSRDWEGWKS